ncbi:MAG TPA: GNAT family N-acetyltransferase [Acidimicrobiales bacterium]|nr:GNAT family N-acetyltransferase [Acidimicrobiales bacterium]
MPTAPAAPTGRLGPDAVAAIAELCRRSLPEDPPSTAELALSLFGGPTPASVRGDPQVGVVATVVRRDAAFVRLLAVDPAHRRRGVGHALMEAAEADLSGSGPITVGADAPDYLFPGVDTRWTPMFCLMEARGYRRVETHLNMDVDLATLPPRPDGVHVADADDRQEVAGWMAAAWPDWADEVLRALDDGHLALSRDSEGISAFCAWDVNRGGWLGPIAVRPGEYGKRLGVPLLLEALHRMRDDGRQRAEIAWVSPIRFYARNVGATVGRAFVVHRKQMRAKA